MKIIIECEIEVPERHGIDPIEPDVVETRKYIIARMHKLMDQAAYCSGSKIETLSVKVL